MNLAAYWESIAKTTIIVVSCYIHLLAKQAVYWFVKFEWLLLDGNFNNFAIKDVAAAANAAVMTLDAH